MGRLRFLQPCSLDLRVSDRDGDFAWAEPSPAVHALVNDLDRETGLHVYGRRMWETMRFWQSMPDEQSVMGDYGRIWRAADKLVVSASLPAVDTERTALQHELEPEALRRRIDAEDRDASIGGPALAASALRAGIVDEVHLLVVPVVVGSGPRALPEDLRASLDLVEARPLDGGWLSLRYTVRRDA